MFAVLKTGGKQYKVQAGDVLRVEKLAADAGEKIQFNDVLMLGGDAPVVGAPFVDGAAVQAEVIDQIKGEKLIHFVKRRRKHSSKRTKGHRQKLTLVKITDILASGADKSGVKAATGKDALTSWDDIFSVESMKALEQCGVAMMDSPTEIMPLILFHLGLDPYSTKAADYKKAEEFMAQLRPYIRYFNSSQFVEDLANGEICAVIGWSGSLFIAQSIAKGTNNGNDIRMAMPEEGTMVWFDNMAIPKGAPHKELAEKFINFILRPEVIAIASNSIGYANPNSKATPLVNEEIKSNPAMYIPEEDMKKLFAQESLSLRTEKIRTRAWTNIKTNR